MKDLAILSKIRCVFLLILGLIAFQVNAQDKLSRAAAAMTDNLSFLGLTDNQKVQITGFNKTAATSLAQLAQKAKADTSFRGTPLIKQVVGVMKKRNDAMKPLLTPDQAKLFEQNQLEQLAELQTRMMSAQLDLTDAQLPQAYLINLKYTEIMLADVNKLQESSSKLKKYKAAKGLKSDSGDKDKEMKKILNADQFGKYQKNKEQMQAAIKEKMQAAKKAKG